jgi:two-component system phosphate regulon sensor histidine kinase PhoR
MDIGLMTQAIINLIDNAIHYSNKNSTVKITSKKVKNSVHIAVKDEGAGIETKHLTRLFERFYRVDKSRSRKHGGTGLGLAIVKHIANIHNGNVAVESKVGSGSTFTIMIPLP